MKHRILSISILLLSVILPAFGEGGGGGQCSRCAIPYPDGYKYLDSSGMALTPSEAAAVCLEGLAGLPFGMEHGGFVILWKNPVPVTALDRARFECYACINDPRFFDSSFQPPIPLDQAGWVAREAYPGRVSSIDTIIEPDETYGLRAGYLVTVVGPSSHEGPGTEKRAAIVHIDPFTAQATVVQEVSTAAQ